MNFYSNNRRFNGDLSQSIEIKLQDFDHCSLQYRLAPQLRAEFFIINLADEALTFLERMSNMVCPSVT